MVVFFVIVMMIAAVAPAAIVMMIVMMIAAVAPAAIVMMIVMMIAAVAIAAITMFALQGGSQPVIMVVAVAVVWFHGTAAGLRFDILPHTERCLKEELSKDLLVIGNYSVESHPALKLDFKIKDPNDQEVFAKQQDDEAHFAFTTDQGGEFLFCFHDIPQPGQRMAYGFTRRVGIEIKTGVEARDYTELAGKENLSKLELEMRKIEDGVADILKDLQYLRKREERMRDTNESTNERVVWLSLFSVATMVTVGVWQIYYLKRYFQQKKIL